MENKAKMSPELTEEDLERLNKRFNPYLWYVPTNGGREVTCTSCRETFTVNYIQRTLRDEDWEVLHTPHGGSARCPRCGRYGEVRSVRKSKSCRDQYGEVAFVRLRREAQDEVYVDCYWLWKSYRLGCGLDCLPRWVSDCCYRLTPEGAEMFQLRMDWRDHRQWTSRGGKIIEPFLRNEGTAGASHIPYDVDSFVPLRETFLEHAAADKYKKYSVISYLCALCGRPGLEQLFKAGYRQIVESYVEGCHFRGCMNLKGTNPGEILKMPPRDVKSLREVDEQSEILRWWAKEGRKRKLSIADVVTFKKGSYHSFCSIENLLGIYEPTKLLTYIERQTRKANDAVDAGAGEMCHAGMALRPTAGRTVDMLLDYRRMAKEQSIRIEDYPRDVYAAHDVVMTEYHRRLQRKTEEQETERLIREDKQWEATNAARRKNAERSDQIHEKDLDKNLRRRIKRYGSFTDGTYMIVVPKNAVDLVDEGYFMHHCVGTYAESFDTGRSDILFVRRVNNVEVPLLTVEVCKKKSGEYYVNQCYGFNDDRALRESEGAHKTVSHATWLKNYSPDVREFAEKLKEYVKNIGKEEQKNGCERKRA